MSRHDDFSRQTPGSFTPPDLGPDATGIYVSDPLGLGRPAGPSCVSSMIDRGQVHARNQGLLAWPTPSGRMTGPMGPAGPPHGAWGCRAATGPSPADWPPAALPAGPPGLGCGHGHGAYSFLLPGLCAQKSGGGPYGPRPPPWGWSPPPAPAGPPAAPFGGLFGGLAADWGGPTLCWVLLFLLLLVTAVACGGRGSPLVLLLREGEAPPAAPARPAAA